MKTFAVTHQGLAKHENQDVYLVKNFENGSLLLAVADGLGGEAGGKWAADMAVASLDDFKPESQVVETHFEELMQAAKQRIMEAVKKEPDLEGMGTTMTAAFVRNGITYWAHVGDSRLYLFRGHEIHQITEDDTMAGFLLSEGQITKDEARIHPGSKFLFQCIGGCGEFEVHIGHFEVHEGDILVLSTDGLHDEVSEEKIVSILGSGIDIKQEAEALVCAALDAGGKDNIALVLAEV